MHLARRSVAPVLPREGPGRMSEHKARIALVVVKPQPGSRAKSSHLVLVRFPWRSKYPTAQCMGAAKRCAAGVCPHVDLVTAGIPRCRGVAR